MEESAEKLETKLDDADLDRQEMCNPRIDREDYNDLMNDGTMISGTTFSKKWLHCTLVELLRQVQEKDINLPENLQNKLCIVWDISIHGNVALELHSYHLINFLFSVIEISSKPRVVEICFGIIANMFSVESILIDCIDKDILHLILSNFDTKDVPTIIQLLRLSEILINYDGKLLDEEDFLLIYHITISYITHFVSEQITLDSVKIIYRVVGSHYYKYCSKFDNLSMITAICKVYRDLENSNIDRKLYIFKFLYISINLKNGYTNNMSDDEIEENITMFTIQYTIVMKILTKIDIKNVSQTMDIEVEEFILVLQTCQQVAYSIWNLISHSDCIQTKLENICTKNCKLLKELLHLNDKVENIDEHHYTMIQLLYKTLKSFLGVKVNGINLNIYDTENLINQVETMNLINNS